jgi:hypothetical protein
MAQLTGYTPLILHGVSTASGVAKPWHINRIFEPLVKDQVACARSWN